MTPRIEVHLEAEDLRSALQDDVRVGFSARPFELPPKWFYDERGCDLFDRITRLPEYYPTRTERQILAEMAPQIMAASEADTLVELGSGTSEKTRILLDAMVAADRLTGIVAFDVSEYAIRQATAALAADYKRAEVVGIVGDFDRHLDFLPTTGRRMVAFLGSTLGNLNPLQRKRFLAELAARLAPGDTLLLGTDLIKEPARLEAAYDDSAGVTAAFNRNVLAVVNRELGADFDLATFEHCARWDAEATLMQMSLRSLHDQRVWIANLELTVELAAGETIRTEISTKFSRPVVEAELASAGLSLMGWWTDPAGDFAISLAMA